MATPPIEELDARELAETLDSYACTHDDASLQPHQTAFLVGLHQEMRSGVVSYDLALLDETSRLERFALSRTGIEDILDIVQQLFDQTQTVTTPAFRKQVMECLNGESHAVTLVVHGKSLSRRFLPIKLEDVH